MIDLASVDETEPAVSGLEQDPLDELPVAVTVVAQDRATETKDEGIDPLETETDAELFGLLWPLANPLKLDPTVDRNVFRKQRDRLKALGYKFQAINQQWLKD